MVLAIPFFLTSHSGRDTFQVLDVGVDNTGSEFGNGVLSIE